MKLAQYLFERELSDDDFAALVGCHRSRINRIKRGEDVPSPKLAIRIKEATDGAVSPNDLYCGEAA